MRSEAVIGRGKKSTSIMAANSAGAAHSGWRCIAPECQFELSVLPPGCLNICPKCGEKQKKKGGVNNASTASAGDQTPISGVGQGSTAAVPAGHGKQSSGPHESAYEAAHKPPTRDLETMPHGGQKIPLLSRDSTQEVSTDITQSAPKPTTGHSASINPSLQGSTQGGSGDAQPLSPHQPSSKNESSPTHPPDCTSENSGVSSAHPTQESSEMVNFEGPLVPTAINQGSAPNLNYQRVFGECATDVNQKSPSPSSKQNRKQLSQQRIMQQDNEILQVQQQQEQQEKEQMQQQQREDENAEQQKRDKIQLRKNEDALKTEKAEQQRKEVEQQKKELEQERKKLEEQKKEAEQERKELEQQRKELEQQRKELEEQKKKEAEEQKKKEAEEQKKKETEEQKKKEAEEQKRKEAEEQKKKEAEEQKKKEAEEQKKKKADEQKKKEAEEQKEADRWKKKDIKEQEKEADCTSENGNVPSAHPTQESGETANFEGQLVTTSTNQENAPNLHYQQVFGKHTTNENCKSPSTSKRQNQKQQTQQQNQNETMQAEEQKKKEAEEQKKKEAEEQKKKEAEEQKKKEAEEQKKKEAEEQKKKEAEEQKKKEAEEQKKKEVEEQKKKEAEERKKKEAEEQKKKGAEEWEKQNKPDKDGKQSTSQTPGTNGDPLGAADSKTDDNASNKRSRPNSDAEQTNEVLFE